MTGETTDWHPHDDDLVALALGDQATDRPAIVRHLAGCLRCRREYDELSDAVEQTLPAAPRVEPEPGFDTAVLAAMGIEHSRPRRTFRVALAAAAAVGLLLGGVGTWALVRPEQAGSTTYATGVLAGGSPLRDGSGASVGAVVRTSMQGRRVAVIELADAHPGMHYRCRLVAADGTTTPAGDWTVVRSDGGTWVVPVRGRDVRLDLLTDSGTLWASAKI